MASEIRLTEEEVLAICRQNNDWYLPDLARRIETASLRKVALILVESIELGDGVDTGRIWRNEATLNIAKLLEREAAKEGE